MKTIKLFGDLKKFNPVWELNVLTPAEALRAIDVNCPGFLQLADKGDYVLLLMDEEHPENIRAVTAENALAPWANEELWVMPRIEGEIIAPAVIAAFAAVGVTVGATAAMVIATVLNMVISLALSMIASLISGSNDGISPSATETPENRPSYLFNGAVNTNRQGHRMAVIYGGPIKTGSMVLSADLYAKDTPV